MIPASGKGLNEDALFKMAEMSATNSNREEMLTECAGQWQFTYRYQHDPDGEQGWLTTYRLGGILEKLKKMLSQSRLRA